MEKKKCSACGKLLALTEFYKSKQTKDGLYAQCKTCHKQRVNAWADANRGSLKTYLKNWQKKNPGKLAAYQRKARYKNKYGITVEEAEALLKSQGGKCKICRRKPKMQHIDHCHKTGTVRGVLCGPCNTGLGHFGDDPDRLKAAAAYLLSSK